MHRFGCGGSRCFGGGGRADVTVSWHGLRRFGSIRTDLDIFIIIIILIINNNDNNNKITVSKTKLKI